MSCRISFFLSNFLSVQSPALLNGHSNKMAITKIKKKLPTKSNDKTRRRTPKACDRGGVTVTLPMAILGLVLGCLTICVEVPGRGLGGEYTAAPTLSGGSGRIDNRS
jgi:hypothetical protein